MNVSHRDVVRFIEACPDDVLIDLRGQVAGVIVERNSADPIPVDREQESAWDPWRVLRQHPEARLQWATLPGTNRGLIEVRTETRRVPTVTLGHDLTRRAALEVLTHEVTHLERGVATLDDDPDCREAEEAVVRSLTRRRMARYERSRTVVGAAL